MILAWFASAAFALPSFPGAIRDELGMDCTPPCVACHQTAMGGLGTVGDDSDPPRPFGQAMKDRGLTADDSDSVFAALEQLAADAVDSDEDGVPDVDELAEGGDPNGGEPFCASPGPYYGCLSHAPFPAGLFALGLAIGAQVGRARIGRRR